MDYTIVLPIALLALVIIGAGAFIFGRYSDVTWRTKTFRKMFKKNFVQLKHVSSDGKTIAARMVNTDKDTYEVADNMWVAENGRIYRENKVEANFNVKSKSTPIKWEEGCPTIYVNEDTLQPIDFFQEEKTVKPNQLSSILHAWVSNQIAKGMAANKQQNLFVILACVFAFLALVVSLVNFNTLGEVKDTVNAIKGIVAPAAAQTGQTSSNGAIIIDKTTGGSNG